MGFDIGAFATRLKELFLNSPLFPNAPEIYTNDWGVSQTEQKKHKGREPLKLKTAVENSFAVSTIVMQDMVTFDLGNESMERTHPYYHILENSPIIRKKNEGTSKTLGSQSRVEDVGKRDYERVSWNGKTFTKEYARNVRGSRNRLNNVSHYITDSRGNRKMVNRESSSYQNVHYMYIERILDSGILDTLAAENNMKLKRKVDSGLAEEYSLETFEDTPTDMLQIFASFD